jgi:MATE family multidrug resistance protein
MGVEGAVIASLVGEIVAVLAMLAIVFRPKYRAAYATVRGWRFEPALFVRLVRFGLPAGLQYSLEILAFAVFMMIIGRIGTAELAASSVAFNFNLIVFMPMVGLATAVSSLVGRYLGANRPDVAERSVYRALAVSLSYMTLCGLLYVGAPGLLLAPYYGGADPLGFAAVEPIATVLLRFVAVYSIFDAMNLVFAAGLKGAGDTLYPLGLTIGLSWALLLGPSYWLCVVGGAGVYTAWTAASAYVIVLGVLMWRRFHTGRWRSMRVIEDAPAV